jgi:hypothetical protein
MNIRTGESVWVLHGQVEYEDHNTYGVYSSLELAKQAAELHLPRLGGRGPSNDTWFKKLPTPDDWHEEFGTYRLNVKKSGFDLQITEHELDHDAQA